MSLVDVDSLGKDIARLADRTYHVVSFLWLIAGDVLYLVICLIECRTDEVCHTSINDGKLLDCALLHIENLGDEASHLTYYGTTQLEVQLLSLTQFQELGIGVEVSLEVWDWHTVRVVVVDAKTATHIDVLHYDVMAFELVLQFVDTIAECLEVTHVKYLTTNVEVLSLIHI